MSIRLFPPHPGLVSLGHPSPYLRRGARLTKAEKLVYNPNEINTARWFFIMPQIYNKNSEMEKRRLLRKNSTKTEVILWKYLRNRRLAGCKFRRQYSVECFVIDFYCPKLRLAIEIDGGYHCDEEVQEYDRGRQQYIEDLGIRFLRFTNEEITNDINKVLKEILNHCPLSSSEERGRG